jgi:hypothetical protein
MEFGGDACGVGMTCHICASAMFDIVSKPEEEV